MILAKTKRGECGVMFTRLLILFTLIAAVCSAANIVLNPGFESGTTTSWTVVGFSVAGVSSYPGYSHTGTYSVETPCVGHGCIDPVSGAYVQQTLNTVAGQNYTLSFWVTENSGATSEMAVYWNGNLVQDILNPNNSGGTTGWQQFTFSNLLATSTSTVLQVNGRHDPAEIFFDDFSVDASVVGVPEPATFGICGLGLALLAAGLRRR
jgi:hypothetical protein